MDSHEAGDVDGYIIIITHVVYINTDARTHTYYIIYIFDGKSK